MQIFIASYNQTECVVGTGIQDYYLLYNRTHGTTEIKEVIQ